MTKVKAKLSQQVGEVVQENNHPVNESSQTERKPYTINEKIVKTLIAKHLENSRISVAITDLFDIEDVNPKKEIAIPFVLLKVLFLFP